ncbi:hypothetical protein [Oenococcus oeni]|uniref:hypothetical protein n=1 Tax=Oenococcus oeni TaxID=1247 RepID=UPI00280E2698|nr:hypothetical protein [Oenococcus oeni]MDQ8696935.1 hypothetical protein [Oenococcus oeni]
MSWFKRNNEIDNRPNQPTYPETIVKRPPENNHRKEKIYIVMAYKWDEYDEHKDVFVDRVFKHKSDALAYIIRHQSYINMCDANPIEMKVY